MSHDSGQYFPYEVGNGAIAWKVKSDTIFAAGLFNGPAGSPFENDGDGHARIPPLKYPIRRKHLGQALDIERAVFITRSVLSDDVKIEEM